MHGRGRTWGALLLTAALLLTSCSGDDDPSSATTTTTDPSAVVGDPTDLPVEVDPDEETVAATFTVNAGTETVTVVDAEPGARLSLVREGRRLAILKADKYGQAHFAYVPTVLQELQTGGRATLPTMDGTTVEGGDGYTIRAEDESPVQASEPFTILGRDDNPPASFFEEQAGDLVPSGDQTQIFGYITTRDGVKLSAMVRLPGPASEGPYPTVIEYSGYGPSNPGATEPGSLIAGSLMGYATVGVNMRGSGCSGGVFELFNTAQQTDGYDVVEAVAHQPWVQGGKVGMVGLSYSGITQIYTASTNPPSLAAVTSLSVIKDPWLQQWPGGVYNGGFTKNWLAERDRQSSAGGTSWVQKRIDEGDQVCEDNQQIREQNIDFESFGRSLDRRPAIADSRDLSKLVADIDVPVYLSGAWQDEQTGPQFADMLGNFDNAPVTKFLLFNGRHPDGYSPEALTRWAEFLSLYVKGSVPNVPEATRGLVPSVFESQFGIPGLELGPDRFADFGPDDYDAAREWYESTPDVTVLFDMGADAERPGAPEPSFAVDYETWPPSGTEARSFYLDADGALADDAPEVTGIDRFLNDPASGSKVFFPEDPGYELLSPTWTFDWTDFDDGDAVDYVSEPFTEATVLGGPGYAELSMRVPDGDADVQVSVSLIDAEGTEWLVTNGLLRLSDRKEDPAASDGLRIGRSFSADDAADMPADEFETVRVALPSFAQAFRVGDRLKVSVSGPGRNFGAWSFDVTGDDGTPRDVGRGGDQGSRLVVGVLPGIGDVPELVAACPSLRGQACRPFRPRTNVPAD